MSRVFNTKLPVKSSFIKTKMCDCKEENKNEKNLRKILLTD